MKTLLEQIGQSGSNKKQLTVKLLKQPARLPDVLAGLQADTARIKFGCAKVLRRISELRPDLLYPHFDFFVGLLSHRNKILQWDAAFILSHLARVDAAAKFDALFDPYFAPIRGPVMITAANVIGGAARIAQAKPHLSDRIAAEILRVQRARYQTPECRNVAIGDAIESLAAFFGQIHDKDPVLEFVRKQLKNRRHSTRQKAILFLRQYGGDPLAKAVG
jgi:hypothetical protein